MNSTATETPRAQALALREKLERWAPNIQRAMPDPGAIGQFVAAFEIAARFAPKLWQCSHQSVYSGLLACAQLGLIPARESKLVHFVPHENRKLGTLDLQLYVGYAGLVLLAIRSGHVASINAQCVFERDAFDIDLGEPRVEHRPSLGARGHMVGAYCVVRLSTGGEQLTFMTREEIFRIRDSSAKGANDKFSPWQLHPDEMARKTVLRRALKTVPLGADMVARLDTIDGKAGRAELVINGDEAQEHPDDADDSRANNGPST